MTAAAQFPLHRAVQGVVDAPIEAVFDHLDNPRHLADHMASPSAMMAGSSMSIETDERAGRTIGSRISMRGRMLGLTLSLDEAVTEREPPRHKAWQTLGQPRLVVMAGYRMGLDLEPLQSQTRLQVWIDYALPPGFWARMLGRWLAGTYANWCLEQMLRGTQRHFARPAA